MDTAKTGVDVTPRRLSSSTAVSVGEERHDPIFASTPAGWTSPSTVLETGSAIPVALSRTDTAKQVQIQRVRDSITEMSTLLNEMRQMRQKKTSANADSVGGETLYQDAASSVTSREPSPAEDDDASILRRYQAQIDAQYSDDNSIPLSRPVSTTPPQAPLPQSRSLKPEERLGQPFDTRHPVIKETSRKNTPVKQAASVEFDSFMAAQTVSPGNKTPETPASQKSLRTRPKKANLSSISGMSDRAQAPSKLLAQVNYPVLDDDDDLYDTDATEHKVLAASEAPKPPQHRRSFTTNDIVHSRKSTLVDAKPERTQSVDDSAKRTPGKHKHRVKSEVQREKSESRRRSSKKAFEKDTIQSLLQQNDTYGLEDIDLPSAERRLIEKFIDALSKLSIEVQMDETKRAEGRRRLHNALRALEGWI